MTAATETHVHTPFHSENFYELVIRDGEELDRAIVQDPDERSVRRLLAVSVTGFGLFGLVVGLAAQFVGITGDLALWMGSLPALTFPIALTGSFLVSLAICLPSFWFYTQLAGVDASFRLVTLQALRVHARTATLLLGALPFYAAIALAFAAGFIRESAVVIEVGVALPFAVGLFGIVALYRSFGRLAKQLPVSHKRRPFFATGLVFTWSLVFTAVCPVALYRAGEMLGGLFG